MSDLTDAIKNVDEEIKEIENKSIKKVKNDENYNPEKKLIKQCKFDKIGYCKKGYENCEFFHSLETCDIYLESGFCNKEKCRKRHPRPCFYFGRGYCKWDKECRYLHLNKKEEINCDNCDKDCCQN